MEMRNIRLTVEYDGTRYHGWQSPKKDSSSTISGRMTEVLRKMTEEEIVLFCGEKTEPGVHAVCQTVNFKTESRMSEKETRQYLNHYLPLDIAVRDVMEVSGRFHAELNPHMIIYRYRIMAGDTEDVFQRRYVDFRTEMPDIQRMKSAAEQLKGQHDFREFSAGKTKKSTERELVDLQILNIDQKKYKFSEAAIVIKANGFLKQMPQKIIGTLLDIGYGKRNTDCIESIFAGRENASVYCLNQALFLEKIEYKV